MNGGRLALILTLAAGATVIAGCDTPGASPSASAGGLADRDPALAKKLVDEGALLLDVRSSVEFTTGSIDGAKNVPHTQIADRIDEIAAWQGGDKHKPIVVFCRSGKRADTAKAALATAGFDQVTNLGGVSDWPQ